MSCDEQKRSSGRGTTISVAEFAQLSEAQLIDIRPKNEFQEDGISGALNIFLHDIVNHADKIDKTKPVYIYCKNGSKSAIAVMVLKDLGYEVYNIDGGIAACKEAGIF